LQSKYDTTKAHYKQVKAERDKQAALYSEEVAKHKGTVQKLADASLELAELKAKQDDYLVVVGMLCLIDRCVLEVVTLYLLTLIFDH